MTETCFRWFDGITPTRFLTFNLSEIAHPPFYNHEIHIYAQLPSSEYISKKCKGAFVSEVAENNFRQMETRNQKTRSERCLKMSLELSQKQSDLERTYVSEAPWATFFLKLCWPKNNSVKFIKNCGEKCLEIKKVRGEFHSIAEESGEKNGNEDKPTNDGEQREAKNCGATSSCKKILLQEKVFIPVNEYPNVSSFDYNFNCIRLSFWMGDDNSNWLFSSKLPLFYRSSGEFGG